MLRHAKPTLVTYAARDSVVIIATAVPETTETLSFRAQVSQGSPCTGFLQGACRVTLTFVERHHLRRATLADSVPPSPPALFRRENREVRVPTGSSPRRGQPRSALPGRPLTFGSRGTAWARVGSLHLEHGGTTGGALGPGARSTVAGALARPGGEPRHAGQRAAVHSSEAASSDGPPSGRGNGI